MDQGGHAVDRSSAAATAPGSPPGIAVDARAAVVGALVLAHQGKGPPGTQHVTYLLQHRSQPIQQETQQAQQADSRKESGAATGCELPHGSAPHR